MPIVIYCNISRCKNDNFEMKNCGIFLIFAQNIDCEAVGLNIFISTICT